MIKKRSFRLADEQSFPCCGEQPTLKRRLRDRELRHAELNPRSPLLRSLQQPRHQSSM